MPAIQILKDSGKKAIGTSLKAKLSPAEKSLPQW